MTMMILMMIMIIRMIAILLMVLALSGPLVQAPWSWLLGLGSLVWTLCPVPAAGYRDDS